MKITSFAAVIMLAAPLVVVDYLVAGAGAAEPVAATGTVTAEGLSSTRDHGIVKVVPDEKLADGRLVLKVVAFNRDHAPAAFGPESVRVFTGSGQQVALMSVEQLVKEVRGSRGDRLPRAVDVFGSSGPLVGRDEAGRPDVSNYTGGSNSMGSTISTREQRQPDGGGDDAKVQQQVAELQAALLKPVTIEPSEAAGGQVVTQKVKFGRKEERALRVQVDFNGEQHEFNFAAPAAH
jgi:hypothetical protein